MEICIILDSSEDNAAELQDLVLSVESGLEFEVFSSVQDFADWFKELGESPPEDEFKVRLLISASELLGVKHVSLFTKMSRYMLEKGYLKEPSQRIPLVISSYDDGNFDSTAYQLPIFDNVIFKPFSDLVAKGKVQFALSGEDALNDGSLRKLKPVSPLEMLKSVTVDRISELGFRSLSSREIDVGKVARYYIDPLKSLGQDYGVYAVCTSTFPHEDGERFYCRFSYFGLTGEQAKKIRLLIAETEDTRKLNFDEAEDAGDEIGIGIVVPQADRRENLANLISRSFSNVSVSTFRSYSDFYSEVDPQAVLDDWLSSFGDVPNAEVSLTPEGRFLKIGVNDDIVEEYLGLPLEVFCGIGDWISQSESEDVFAQILSGGWQGELTFTVPHMDKEWYLTLVSAQVTEGRVVLSLRPPTVEELEGRHDTSRIPQNLKMLFLSEEVVRGRRERLLSFAHDKELLPLVVGKSKLEIYDQAKSYEGFLDFLVEPVDPVYVKRKLKYLLPQLKSEDDGRDYLERTQEIRVGTQVEMNHFSEVSLSFVYHRALAADAFRNFVIFIQKESQFEEITGKHVATESEGDEVVNHFTLFGHGDRTNQLIRQWLNEQYILAKKEEESQAES